MGLFDRVGLIFTRIVKEGGNTRNGGGGGCYLFFDIMKRSIESFLCVDNWTCSLLFKIIIWKQKSLQEVDLIGLYQLMFNYFGRRNTDYSIYIAYLYRVICLDRPSTASRWWGPWWTASSLFWRGTFIRYLYTF